MKATFWGVRGSIPQPTSKHIVTEKYGGNTTCLTIEFDNHTLIFDAGTGINAYGRNCGKRKHFMLIFTHFHHDHVHGFPFFLPIYLPNRIIHYYSPKLIKNSLYKVLESEFDPPFFPYRFENTIVRKIFSVIDHMDSIRLLNIKDESQFKECLVASGYEDAFLEEILEEFPNWENTHLVANVSLPKLPYETARIDVMENLAHPNVGSYIYKVRSENKTIIFATDIEGKVGGSHRLIKFCENADVLIHDAQYFPEDYPRFQDFGHSTYEMACDHAIKANVKKLYLTHHDPWSSDEKLDELQSRAEKYIKEQGGNLEVKVAMEGEIF